MIPAVGLSEAKKCTGHCFLKFSAKLLVDVGADMNNLKRHRTWKSDSVAECTGRGVCSDISQK